MLVAVCFVVSFLFGSYRWSVLLLTPLIELTLILEKNLAALQVRSRVKTSTKKTRRWLLTLAHPPCSLPALLLPLRDRHLKMVEVDVEVSGASQKQRGEASHRAGGGAEAQSPSMICGGCRRGTCSRPTLSG